MLFIVNLTEDERLYLEQLCDGPKTGSKVAGDIMANEDIQVVHHSDSVTDRLEDLVKRTQLVTKNSNGRLKLTKKRSKGDLLNRKSESTHWS